MAPHRLHESIEACIDALDQTIASGPTAPHEEIAVAVGCVIALRNEILECTRSGQVDKELLDQANSLVSLAYGAEHPLIGVHLHRLKQTRDGVSALRARL